MSKFFKALEQAERDRQRKGSALDAAAGSTRPASALPPGEEGQRSPEGVAATEPVKLREAHSNGFEEHLVSLVDPASSDAEQYRTLRNIVERLSKTGRPYVLAVSSPGPGDGKTVTAINLAGALSQSESSRVVLLDADFRGPSVAKKLGYLPSRGLVDAIRDPAMSLQEVASVVSRFNLTVVPAGHATTSPYEMLSAPRFKELLDEVRHRYDFVVMDTPPVVPFPDCRLISECVDGFLLVVAAHRTPRELLEEALRALDPSKVVGLVFNNADGRTASHYYYYGNGNAPGHRWWNPLAWRRKG